MTDESEGYQAFKTMLLDDAFNDATVRQRIDIETAYHLKRIADALESMKHSGVLAWTTKV